MHRLLCLIMLALTAPALAFADTPAPKEVLPATPVEQAAPDLNAENAGDAKQGDTQQVPDVSLDLLCDTLAASAQTSGLPVSFFSNLIWQESRFMFRAVSPAGALGIAQFMPRTAAAIGLTNPFDPLMALPASARLLGTLFQRFGNLGLAAAAYNAGEARVSNWLSNKSGLPQETRNYVLAITGISIEGWISTDRKDRMAEGAATSDCRELIALLNRAPNRFVAQLERSAMRDAIKPWGVQVAAGFGRDKALFMYAQAMKELTAAIGAQGEPILFRSRGTSSFYQVRIGAGTRREANDLCGRIRRTGGACLVKRRQA